MIELNKVECKFNYSCLCFLKKKKKKTLSLYCKKCTEINIPWVKSNLKANGLGIEYTKQKQFKIIKKSSLEENF